MSHDTFGDNNYHINNDESNSDQDTELPFIDVKNYEFKMLNTGYTVFCGDCSVYGCTCLLVITLFITLAQSAVYRKKLWAENSTSLKVPSSPIVMY